MATPKMKGVQALWGVGSIYSSELVTDVRRKDGGAADFIFDNNGFEITKIFFGDNTEVEIDLIMKTGTAVPVRGDTLVVTAGPTIVGTLLVDNVETMWTQKGWTKLKIPATAYVNLTA